MIISRTPLRISFAGGGSDLHAYYGQEPGAVISTAIDKYIYITVNPKFDEQIRASYSRTEMVDSVDELQHDKTWVVEPALKYTHLRCESEREHSNQHNDHAAQQPVEPAIRPIAQVAFGL